MKAKTKKAKSKVPASVSYDARLLEDLKDVDYAAQYLTACMGGDTDEDFEVFFEALKKIVTAHGVTNVARKMNKTRDALYKAFNSHKNPTLKTFRETLHGLDLEIAIVPRHR